MDLTFVRWPEPQLKINSNVASSTEGEKLLTRPSEQLFPAFFVVLESCLLPLFLPNVNISYCCVCVCVAGTRILLNDTSIMPDIPGLPALVTMLFTPVMELRSVRLITVPIKGGTIIKSY